MRIIASSLSRRRAPHSDFEQAFDFCNRTLFLCFLPHSTLTSARSTRRLGVMTTLDLERSAGEIGNKRREFYISTFPTFAALQVSHAPRERAQTDGELAETPRGEYSALSRSLSLTLPNCDIGAPHRSRGTFSTFRHGIAC